MLGIAQNRISVSPAQPLDKAVSGHYAAWTNDGLATYGGCNFPDVPCADGGWIHFDFVPGEADVRTGEPDVIGKLCVIGSKINKDAVSELFGVKLKA